MIIQGFFCVVFALASVIVGLTGGAMFAAGAALPGAALIAIAINLFTAMVILATLGTVHKELTTKLKNISTLLLGKDDHNV